VPDVTNINSTALPELNWASRLGASCLRVGFLGTGVLGVSSGITASAAASQALPRVRDKVAFVAPPRQEDAVATQLSQTDSHNYMTGAVAVGEGASGPPPYREPV
jgi:hypothetical protein